MTDEKPSGNDKPTHTNAKLEDLSSPNQELSEQQAKTVKGGTEPRPHNRADGFARRLND
jgi:hypothetical protein